MTSTTDRRTEPAARTPEPEPETPATPDETAGGPMLREIAAGNALAASSLSCWRSLVGSLLIAVTDEGVRDTAGYVSARPGDFFSATWDAVWGAYTALFRGSVYNTASTTSRPGIRR